MSAPETLNGMHKSFEEIFVSPYEEDSRDDALKVLEEIRRCHDISRGWLEVSASIEQLPNGKWRAVRHHVKYK